MMNRLVYGTFCSAALLLSACTSTGIDRDAQARAARAQEAAQQVGFDGLRQAPNRSSREQVERLAAQQQRPRLVKRSSGTWVGSDVVPVNADDRLPDFFSRRYVMSFSDEGAGVSLSQVASRLSDMVGVPVRISSDVFEKNEDAAAVRLQPVARGSSPLALNVSVGDQGDIRVRMNWDGTLTDFLNYITDRYNLSWEFTNNTILIRRFTTEMHQLAAYPNGFDYTLSSGTAGGGGGGGSGGAQGSGGQGGGGQGGAGGSTLSAPGSFNVSESGNVHGLRSLLQIIEKLLREAPGSEVMVSEGTGRLMVKTTKDLQTRIRELVRTENENMLKQVFVQIDLYTLTTNSSKQQGIDWNAFYRSLSRRLDFRITAPPTLTQNTSRFAVSRDALGERGFDSGAAILQALYEVGDSVQHRPVSLVAMNRQWARKARLNSTGFLSGTTAGQAGALGGGTAVPGLQTSTIVTGDQFAVMPFVLQNNTIMLKVGISLSDLINLLSVTTGEGATLQQVQTPNTSSLSDQFTVALQPGEVLAITGLTRDSSTTDQRRLGQRVPIAAGGSTTANQRTENFVVFIRAVML